LRERSHTSRFNHEHSHSFAESPGSPVPEELRTLLSDSKVHIFRPGDTLLLEAYPRFVGRYVDSAHFLLLRMVQTDDVAPQSNFQAFIAGVILVAMVVLTATNSLDLLSAALMASTGLILAGCMTLDEAMSAVRMRVIVAVVCTFGLGKALEHSGVATAIATQIVSATAGGGRYIVLCAIFLVTTMLGSFINNNACVVLMWPIAKQTALGAGLPINQVVMTLLFACSSSFMTPMSYQTNLMVYEPGGYAFLDFAKLGGPLTLVLMAVTVSMVPLFYS